MLLFIVFAKTIYLFKCLLDKRWPSNTTMKRSFNWTVCYTDIFGTPFGLIQGKALNISRKCCCKNINQHWNIESVVSIYFPLATLQTESGHLWLGLSRCRRCPCAPGAAAPGSWSPRWSSSWTRCRSLTPRPCSPCCPAGCSCAAASPRPRPRSPCPRSSRSRGSFCRTSGSLPRTDLALEEAVAENENCNA